MRIFGEKSAKISIKIGEAHVKESNEEKLFGITFDQTFNFMQLVKTLCKKASQKLHALAGISGYMGTDKLSKAMQVFI